MAIADILRMLTKPTQPQSTAELKAALDAIDLKALEQEVDRLEVERRRLLIHGNDAEITAIGKEITAANLSCERGSAIVDEITKKITEAEARETAAETERQGALGKAALQRGFDAYVELDLVARRLIELRDEITACDRDIRAANDHVLRAGRPDLKTIPPIAHLAQLLGISADRLPQIQSWELPGYSQTAFSAPVREEWRFSRMKELMAPSIERKAAA